MCLDPSYPFGVVTKRSAAGVHLRGQGTPDGLSSGPDVRVPVITGALIAALAMSGSSILVTLNALRLNRAGAPARERTPRPEPAEVAA